jgi:hypothetical protein
MFYNSTYFFFPPARPVSGNLPARVERWFEIFGEAMPPLSTRAAGVLR